MGIYGQDWASYQPAQPSTDGLSFAIVKVTEGLGYINPRWVSQRDHAKANGLVVGLYHYPHMGNSVQAEADRFLAQVAWQPGDLIVLDWEGYDSANTSVSKATQLAYKDQWLRYVKGRMPHNPVGVYMNTDYWNHVDVGGYVADFLWIATAGRAAGDPGISASWLFHQYGGDGDTDLDYCHLGSVDELRAWALGFAEQQPTPTPVEDIVTPEDIKAVAAASADAVWGHQVPVPRVQPDGSVAYPFSQGAVWPLIWGNVWNAQLHTHIAAQQAALTALITELGAAHAGVDTATVVAAVEAAIANAVVKVDVSVNATPQS
jgi:hypothetical protein